MTKQERIQKLKEFVSSFGNIDMFEVGEINKSRSVDELENILDNIYFLGEVKNCKKGGVKRGTEDKDIINKRYFGIDIDIRKNKAKLYGKELKDISDESLFEDIEAVKNIIEEDKLLSQWSYINFSGNGMHIFYIGDVLEGIGIDEYQNGVNYIYQEFDKFMANKFNVFNYFYTDYSTTNIARVFRLPYSFNIKKDMDNRKIPTKIMFQKKCKSDLVSMIPELSKKRIDHKKQYDDRAIEILKTEEVKGTGFMYDFVSYIDKNINIRDVLKKLNMPYSGMFLYEGDRLTTGWKIWNNAIVNKSDDADDYNRIEGGCYSIVKKKLGHIERKDTLSRFKNEFDIVNQRYEKNADKYGRKEIKDIWIKNPDVSMNYTISNYTWGVPNMDKNFHRMNRNGELITLYGNPGMGKTEFAFFIARENKKKGIKTLFLSLELAVPGLIQRWSLLKAGYTWEDVETGNLSDEDKSKIDYQISKIQNQCKDGIELVGIKQSPTVQQILDILDEYHNKGFGLFIIDNLGKINKENKEEIVAFDIITNQLQTRCTQNNKTQVLLLHHANKGERSKNISLSDLQQEVKPAGPNGFRGSQKIFDNSQRMMEIYREFGTNTSLVFQYKHTYTGDTASILLDFVKGDYIEQKF